MEKIVVAINAGCLFNRKLSISRRVYFYNDISHLLSHAVR